MKTLRLIREKIFYALTYVFFNRKHSFTFCIIFSLLSLAAEIFAKIPTLFSCSGAVVTIAGLFLNIKHSLNFHLKIPKLNLYNKLSGAGIFGSAAMTSEQEKWVENIISDEIFGVSFMIAGTIIWAYGSFFVRLLQYT